MKLKGLAIGLLLFNFWSALPTPAYAGNSGQPVAASAALPAGMEQVTSVEGITEYRLPNGLKVLLFPDKSKQNVTVNVTYLVGSKHENYGETGMAHLLEHMLFKGSQNHTELTKEFDQHGAQFNASTSLDRTNYFETMQSSEANLRWALEMEADRMVTSFVARKDLDSEMTVVRNEFESGENSPFRVLLERVQSTAFLWHNYGKSTIGARSDIENVPTDRLQAFYHNYYQPDNAVLLVAGNFDEAKTLDMIASFFGKIPKPTRQLQKFYTLDPVQDGERSVVVRRVGNIQVINAAYHITAGIHPDYPALDLLSNILGDTPSGRLHKALVETKKATNSGGFNFQQREPGLASFFAIVPKDKSLDEAKEVLLKTLEDISSSPITEDEVEQARRRALADIDQVLNSSENLGLNLSEWIAMGDWRLFFLHRDNLKKVTAADVQRVATKYLLISNRTLGLFMPTDKLVRAEIPETPDAAKLLENYKGGEAVAKGEEFDPSTKNIESRTLRLDAKEGLKLALLPKTTRGKTVVAQINFHLGTEASLTNRSVAANLVGQMLMRGTSKHTRQQISDEFAKLKAQVGVGGTATNAFVTVQTVRESLPDTLKLIAEILRDPAFPEKELELLKQQRITNIEASKTEPNAIAALALRKHLNAQYPKGDVRYVATPDEQIADIKAISLDDLKKFYQDFYGGSYGEVAIVGDFDAKEMEQLTNQLFSNWKNKSPYQRIVSNYKDLEVVNKNFETPDKANAIFLAILPVNMKDDDPDYPALDLANYILGGSSNSRLEDRIREKEGISYSIGSFLGIDSEDKAGIFQIFAIYAPQNRERLEKAFREELDRILKDGVTAEELARAKSGYLQQRQISRAEDAGLVGQLNEYRRLNRTLAWDEDFERKISALTPEQLVEALRKHIKTEKISIFKAGDFAKAANQAPSK